ncbi:hypothetical protein N7509_013033 [Penicillium cosmopolitanum]|uniref:Uncharacterized protein n=1 Tax=Penicillium cosmopolitanum TaxID=1131564 RepID=A0A9W9SCI3_9EURO|nr:uncharacterized protein N7509_013033 [Penicillium cosmopolitanum]KAJ5376147.1 hypothetical protein N7509_013033 [Penicillium cosmopolitanum]
MQQEWAENRLADFNLWSAGAGAYTIGKASLDHRLRANPEAHIIIINLLLMLKILIDKCIDRDSETHTTVEWSDNELARKTDVENSLNQLTRLIVAIRKAGTRSRLQKADSSFDPNCPQIRSLRQHLELLLLVHPDEHGNSDSNKQQLDPARLTLIQLRLIDANLRRRNRFLYAQKHAQKLGIPSGHPKNTQSEEPTLVNQQPNPDVAQTRTYSRAQKIVAKNDPQTRSTTTATVVEEPIVLPSLQQHSKGIRPQQIPMLLSAWRRKVPVNITACPLCAFQTDDQNVLIDHTAEHVHSFSLGSLPWAPTERLGEEQEEEDYGDYFQKHPYFDVDGSLSDATSGSSGVSSLTTDSGSIAGSDLGEWADSTHGQLHQLTENALDQVANGSSEQLGMKHWLAMVSEEAENPTLSPVIKDHSSTSHIVGSRGSLYESDQLDRAERCHLKSTDIKRPDYRH